MKLNFASGLGFAGGFVCESLVRATCRAGVLAVLGVSLTLTAQDEGALIWAKRAGSPSIDDGAAIAVDADGNVYATGYFKLTATFGPGEANEVMITALVQDVFLAKFSPGGELQWVHTAQGFAYANAIALDAIGNIYVFGDIASTTTFNAGQPDEIVLTGLGRDAYLAKFDATGKCLWAKNAGGSGSDYGNGLAVDAVGNSYVTGRYGSNPAVFGAGEPNETTLPGIGGNNGLDIFVAKYNSEGSLQWAKSAGGATGNNGASIGLDAVGNCYVTGSFTGTTIFGPGEVNETTLVGPGGGFDEIFVAKFGADGNLAWVRDGQGQASHDRGTALVVDAEGNSHIAGTYNSKAPFGGQLNPTQLAVGGLDDLFIAKHDTSGNLLWVKMAAGGGNQTATGITLDVEGHVYLTGHSGGVIFGAEEPNEVALNGYPQDFFLAEFDPDGLVQWARLYEGTSSRVVHASDALHIVGRLVGTITLGVGEENETVLTSRGNNDILLAKFRTGTRAVAPAQFVGFRLLPNGIPALLISGDPFATYKILRTEVVPQSDWAEVGELSLDAEGQGTFEDADETLTFPAFYQAAGN